MRAQAEAVPWEEVVAGNRKPLAWGGATTRETLEWKQIKTKKKQKTKKIHKVNKQEDRKHNYLFLKGTGNKYISNDEKLGVADGEKGAPLPCKSFLQMLSTGTN